MCACPKPACIKGEAVVRVETYKYLGVVFDSKLNWKDKINSMLKKVNTRMYCLRKLRSFGVNSGMLVTFYNPVICSIIVLCQFLMKIIIIINLVCECVKTFAEDDDFQRLSKGEWGVCMYLT